MFRLRDEMMDLTKISQLVALTGLGVASAVFGWSAMAQPNGSQSGATNRSDRLICRRMPETGSLSQTRRQCFTRAEWDRIAESQRAGAQRLTQELSGGFNGNN